MSWDVMIFNLSRKASSAEEIDESVLLDIGSGANFKKLMEANYSDIVWEEDFGIIAREDFSIEFSLGALDETFSNIMFHLYGENAIYEVIELCKRNNWQLYDGGLDSMLDLQHPEINGYKNHQQYVRQILNRK